MNLHVPINEDVISVLDRVLDRGIVVDTWVRIGHQGADLIVADVKHCVASSSVYVGYGGRGSWRQINQLKTWFPSWRRDLWSK